MDQEIFKEWYENKLSPKSKSIWSLETFPKAVLLLDNASTHHLKSDDRNFFVQFLPPNITVLIQPMDQGVIASMKKNIEPAYWKIE